MSSTQIGDLAQAVPGFSERDSLADALPELWKGFPALVMQECQPHLLHPVDVVGHQETRRLADLPLVRVEPLPHDTPLWRALDHRRQGEFILVTRGKGEFAIASREAVLDSLLSASDPNGPVNAATVLHVLDQSPEGVVFLDAQRHVHGLNPAAQRMLALLGDVKPGAPIDQLGGVPIEPLLEDARQGLPRDLIIEQPAHRIISVRTLRSAKDGNAGTVFLLRDVTHVRHRQVREASQERMALLGQLSSGIAHDMNNVLTVVAGCTSLMTAGEPTSEFCMSNICSALDRATVLVRQLLAFARREMTDPVSLRIPTLVRSIEGILCRLAGPKVQLTFELDDSTPPVCADPVQIERILTNLVLNARNAMPEGGRVTITVQPHVACRDLKGGRGDVTAARIAVRDTGKGIAPETLPRVFEPYFTTDPMHGTGLGLATVYATVTALRGHVQVDSAVGAGTCFDICLPPDQAMVEESAPAPPANRRHSLASGTLLVAESDPLVRAVTQRVLGTAGYAVASVATREELITRLRSEGEPDLLIADATLLTGQKAEAWTALRASFPRLRVLLMTGYADDEVFDRAELPLVEYIAKPFTGDVLLERVELSVGAAEDGD